MAPKLLADGTKEDIIAHFQNACKAYDLIIAGKDQVIKDLSDAKAILKKKYRELEESKQVHINDDLKQELEKVQDKLRRLKLDIKEYAENL